MNQIIRAPLTGEILAPGDQVRVIAALNPLSMEAETIYVDAGLSVSEIVDICGERLPVSELLVSAIFSVNGVPIPVEDWDAVRVDAGAFVVIRATAEGGSFFKTLLQIALVIVATIVAPGIGTALSISTSLVSGAIIFLGGLALNALFPPAQTNTGDDTKSVYSIAGTRNSINKWGPIPWLFGTERIAPNFAAPPYSEFDGDDQYIRMLLVWGLGPIDIGELKLGETLLSEFDDVEVQTFEGYATDAQQTLYPSEVVQEDLSIELSKKDGPYTRTSAEDAAEIQIDLVAPNGMVDVDTKTGKKNYREATGTVQLLIVGTNTVVQTKPWSFRAKSNDPIRKTIRFTGTNDGQFDARVTQTSNDTGGSDISDTVIWTAIRTIRRSPPIEYGKPLAITALRIKATKQLNGSPDDLNAVCTSRMRSWNGVSWVANTVSKNPGDHFRYALQGPGNARPRTDNQIDLDTIQRWAERCTAMGWEFNMLRNFTATVEDLLRDICAAGRAVPIKRDGKWSVAWEESLAPIAQHFTPRNSWDFVFSPVYRHLPHGLRVKFRNETKGYIEDEKLVFDDGYTKLNATLYEQAEFPGITHPDLIYKHARYRIADAHQRPATYQLTTDFENIVCTRGDRVVIAHDVLDFNQASGRVINVVGNVVTLDEMCTMVGSKLYGLRFRTAAGASILRQVQLVVGTTQSLTLTGTGTLPAIDDLATFGVRNQEVGTYRVLRITRGDDLEATMEFVDDAPNIQNADSGPATGGPGVVVIPPDIATLKPRNLRIVQLIVTQGGAAQHLTRLYFDMPYGLNVASFEVAADSEDTSGGQTLDRQMTVGADARVAEFIDLEPGTWSFMVRAILTDGRYSRFSIPLIALVDPADLPAPFVTDLVLVQGATATIFNGTDPEIQWINNFPSYPAAPSGSNPTYSGNLVRVYDVLTNTPLRTDQTTEARYVYPLAFNKADAAQIGKPAIRQLRFEVAVIDTYGNTSVYVPLTVSNPPPAAMSASVVPGFGQLFVSWAMPNDPDLAGVRVWLETVSGYNPYVTTPKYSGDATQAVIPAPVAGQNYYLRIAAYDAFGVADLNVSGEAVYQSLAQVVDTVAPATPTWPASNFITSVLDGNDVRVTIDWNDNVEADLSNYDLSVKLGAGAYTTIPVVDSRYEFSTKPNLLVAAKVRARDKTGNPSAYTVEKSATTVKDTTPPAAPTGFVVSTGFGTFWGRWTPNTETDLLRYDVYASASATAPVAGTTPTAKMDSSSFTESGYADGVSRYFWVRAVDTSLNASAWVAASPNPATTVAAPGPTAAQIDAVMASTIYAAGINPPKILSALPSPVVSSSPRYVSLSTTGELYEKNAAGNAYVLSSAFSNLTGTIAASQIAANTINASSLVANSITATQIAAGAIGADQVAANAITASKLLVSDWQNLIIDAKLLDNAAWDMTSGGWVLQDNAATTVSPNNLPSARQLYNIFVGSGAAGGSTGSSIVPVERGVVAKMLPVTPGSSFRFSFDWKTLSTAAGTVRLWAEWYDAAGNVIDGPVAVANAVAPSVAVQNAAQTIVAPTGAAFLSYFFQRRYDATGTSSGWFTLGNITLRRVNGGELLVDGSIAANHLTITGEVITNSIQIRDATITNAKIFSLDATKITTGFISADRIQAGSITADKVTIAAGVTLLDWRAGPGNTQINGGQIAANTIRANMVSVGMRGLDISSVEFEHNYNGVINALHWNGGSIGYVNDAGASVLVAISAGSASYSGSMVYVYWVKGSSVLVPTTIYATANQDDRVILATYGGNTNLVANYGRTVIDGSGISANTITATQINVGSISAAILVANAISTGMLQAGAITADKVAANSITASKIYVSNTANIVPDNNLADIDAWGAVGPANWVLMANPYPLPGSGVPSLRVINTNDTLTATAGAVNSIRGSFTSGPVPCIAGEVFQVGFSSRTRGDATAGIRAQVSFYGSDDVAISTVVTSTVFYAGSTGSSDTANTMTAPAGTAYFRYTLRRGTGADGSSSGQLIIWNVNIKRMASADLIVDGSISATKIAANSISATHIAAGSITATELAANSVTAAKIVAGTITASEIVADGISTMFYATNDATQTVAVNTANWLTVASVTVSKGVGWKLLAQCSLNLQRSKSGQNAVVTYVRLLIGGVATPSQLYYMVCDSTGSAWGTVVPIYQAIQSGSGVTQTVEVQISMGGVNEGSLNCRYAGLIASVFKR